MTTITQAQQMTAGEAQSIHLPHPEFLYVSERGADGFPVVVFERRTYYSPTDAQIDQYRRDKQVVEARGGRMIKSEYEIAGTTPFYTAADCASMRALVEAAMPDWRIRTSWNGENCRTYSISIERREL